MTENIEPTLLKPSTKRHTGNNPRHPITKPGQAMKNVLAAIFTLFLASSVFIGCGFVDDNRPDVQLQNDQFGLTYTGISKTTIDTTGYEGP
jgi:hypothetical protein